MSIKYLAEKDMKLKKRKKFCLDIVKGKWKQWILTTEQIVRKRYLHTCRK